MSSQEVDYDAGVDYDALAATTSVEVMTGNEINQDTLRSLKNDNPPYLRLCLPGLPPVDRGDYVLGGSK